jgi:hypothetical protein
MDWFSCLSLRMIQIENRWTDLDEIWYGLYAIGAYLKIILFSYVQTIILTWRTDEHLRWGRDQHVAVGFIVGHQWDTVTPTGPLIMLQLEQSEVNVGRSCATVIWAIITARMI